MCYLYGNNWKTLSHAHHSSLAFVFCVSEDVAFLQISVEFAGLLYVRDNFSKEKQTHKCNITLFSCSSTRANHLELTPELQGNTFVHTVKRFMSRCGIPARILSDNGSTFIDYLV